MTDIANRLHYNNLRQDIGQVLNSLEPLERRVIRDDNETHYLMRILPYRAPESSVDGVVITFVEVTSIVQADDCRSAQFPFVFPDLIRDPASCCVA